MLFNVVEKVKLVGIMLTIDLKWEENTKYLCGKARQKLWLLRRMRGLQLSDVQMLDVYFKEIRFILEKSKFALFKKVVETEVTSYIVPCYLWIMEMAPS